MKRKEKKIYFS